MRTGLRPLALLATLIAPAIAFAAPPTVTTGTASSVTASQAVLNGSINPQGLSATGWFRRSTTAIATCDDTFGVRVPASGGTGVGSGTSATNYTITTTGLSPGTTYWFCAIAQNADGVSFGAVQSFSTPALIPSVTTVAATNVTSTTAEVNGDANPNGSSTSGFFRYSASNPGSCNNTFGIRVPGGSGGTALGSGNGVVSFDETLTGLSPGVTYYACAIAQNGVGTGLGNVLSFTTLVAAPAVTTNNVTGITGTQATFSGTANPNGAATTGWFRYSASNPGGCNDAFGTRVPASGVSLGGGTSNTSFSNTPTTLVPGTTYYVCAIAQNSVGTSFGALETFTTPAAPTVSTLAATNVTANGATLQGSAAPNGAPSTGFFRYSTVDPGLCSDSFGTRIPSSTGSGTSLGSGAAAVPYSQSLSGLLPGTTYYYCALALNTVGTSTGTVMTFTTPPLAPTVNTGSVTQLTGSAAQLNGTAVPRGAEATGHFRYSAVSPGSCNDTFGTRAPATGGAALGSGNSSVAFNQAIAGLTPGTTYYYCAIATNSVGVGLGSLQSFTTPDVPEVTTNAASSFTSGTSAQLNGTVTANGATATAWFRYSTSNPGTCNDAFGTRSPGSGGSTISSGSTNTVAQSISGLTPGTTIYFCAIASNLVGTSFGQVLSFTLPAVPTVVTNAPTVIAATSATLSGTATPNGASAVGWFRYSTVDPVTCVDNFGTRVPSSSGAGLGSGTAPQSWLQNSSTLQPGTTYYVCAFASNSVGTGAGDPVSFTTPATAPIVTTQGASAITGTTATMNGAANPRGAATTGWFRYSTTAPAQCDDTFGTRSPTTGGTSLGSGNGSQSFAQPLTALVPGTTYYYCAIAENSVGKTFGAVQSFDTPNLPTVNTVSASPAGTGTSATLNGSANGNGASATGFFRLGTQHPGTCDETFGSRIPSSSGTAISSYSLQSYLQTASSLTPGTTYYYCAAAQNLVGTAFGAVMSFTTPAAPTVTTVAASSVVANTATLNATANPNLAGSTGWFRYATTNPGTCTDTFGTRAPTSGGTALGNGSAPISYSVTPTGLLPGVTYWYCALASNSAGTGTGVLMSFTTPPLAPSVVTSTVTAVTSSSVNLRGSVNSNGAAATAWFRFSTTNPGTCNDTFGLRAPTSGATSIPAGNSNVTVTEAVSGLSLATTYYYCAIAENSEGKTYGSVLSFNTSPDAPTVTTLAATAITTSAGTLNATANPNGATSTGWFRFSTTNPTTCNDTFGTRAPASGGTALGGGTSPTSYSVTPTTLAAGTTYYYCAIASNSAGTSFGQVLQFTTEATPPTLNTLAATAITGTNADLNASGNPNGAATTGWFRYSTTNPGACNDTFGTRAPLTGGEPLGSTPGNVTYSRTLSGLTPGATYHFCAIAQNAEGTVFGQVLSFTTPAGPLVTTGVASPVTATTATLNASANPNGAASTGWFRYASTDPGTCNDTFGTRAPAGTGTHNLGAGNAAVNYAQPLSGLLPGTTYYYCALAQNLVGLSTGGVLSFTTPSTSPTVATVAPSSVTGTGAALNGQANPNGAATQGWFRWSNVNPGSCNDSFGTRLPATGGQALGSASTATPWTLNVTGLSPGTTYYFCAIASNSVGTTFGGVISFSTPNLPLVTTGGASSVTATGATLSATANPRGDATTGYFRYGTTSPGTCNDTFGTRLPATGGTPVGSGSSAVSYSEALTGLQMGTTYYYCALATNVVGTAVGAVQSFTTPTVPTVVTNPVSTFASTTATLSGSGNPNGIATTAWFRYSTTNPGTCTDSFGTRAPSSGGTSLGSGTAVVNYTQGVTGLQAGTTYYVCTLASNSAGLSVGTVQSFTTTAAPSVATIAATQVTTTSATLNGEANPNGAAATGWFRYATTSPGACSDSFGTRTPSTGGTSLGSGSSAVPFSQGITGLTGGTTYYYCAISQNSVGTRFGTVHSFTAPAAPLVGTVGVDSTTGTTTQLVGSVNPRGSATVAYFRYATTNPGTCNDTFGVRAPATGGVQAGSGGTYVPYEVPVTGLTPATQYWYCAIAESAHGTAFGGVMSFLTPGIPLVNTNTASSITASSITLNGSGNPRGSPATGWYRYDTTDPGTCNDTFGTRAPATGGTSLGSGSNAVSFSRVISGLQSGTTYYYCAIAENDEGMGFGTVRTATTLQGPLVATAAATSVSTTSAVLNGSANPNGQTTTGWFRYSATDPGTCTTTFGTRAPSSGGTSLGSGTSAISYSQTITGLLSGTTYYYCAQAQNSVGTSVGQLLTFTTPGAPAQVQTLAATGVTSNGATFNGSANPNNAAGTGFFRYSTVQPSSCNNTFGTRFPSTGGVSLGSGTSPVPFDQTVTGLASGTTYYYCALAQNSVGTVAGSPVQSFTTTAAPTVTTSASTSVTATGATLNGSANPRGMPGQGWFRYSTSNPGTCNDTFGIRAPGTGGTSLGSGSSAVSYSETVSGLSSGTTYYVCAIASNTAGTSWGLVTSFTTPGAATATTSAATSVTGTGATLNGSGNPNGAAATGHFRYATTSPGTCNDTFGTRAPTTGGTSLGTGSSSIAFSQAVSGLMPGTQYFYCAIATNAVGQGFGTVMSFTTPAAPVVTTNAATALSSASATLNGSANPRGATGTGWFRYSTVQPSSCNDTFGTRAPTSGGTSLGSGSSAVNFSQGIASLTPGTTYYYCALASNSVGTGMGTVQSFTTPAAQPTVTTSAATNIGGNTATFNGAANPNGGAATGWFRYATLNPGTCNDSFGIRTPASGGTQLGSGSSSVPFSQAVSTLTPGTTYYVCALAQNSAGTAVGSVMTFTTPAAPTVSTTAATNIGANSVIAGGTVLANGAQATAWFRYATTNPGTCNDTFGTRSPLSGGTNVPVGTTPTQYTQPLTGLQPGTTYYFCAIAQNAVGTAFGQVLQVRTLAQPTVTTSPATMVTDISARLNGSANPNGAPATGWFRFSATQPSSCNDTFGTRVPAVGGTSLGAGTTAAAFNQNLNDLQPGTTYYYCAIAQNQVGTAFGEVVAFQPMARAPSVTTLAATDVGTRAATLHGNATPNRTATTAWFRYDTVDPVECNDSFGTKISDEGFALGSGVSPVAFTAALEGLKPAQTYYYCAIAGNLGGGAVGEVMTFTTGTEPPVSKTGAAEVLADGSVKLNALGNGNGLEATAWFRYDFQDPMVCNYTFGAQIPLPGQQLGKGHEEVAFTETVRSLKPGKYYYCSIVQTSAGTAYGIVENFTVGGEEEGAGCGCSTSASGGGMLAVLFGFVALALGARRRRGQRE